MFHFGARRWYRGARVTRLKILVDRDRCEGNAVCVRVAGDVFRVDDDDRLHVLVERPTGEARERVEVAVRRCPRHALSLVDDDAPAG